jgi:hypothetical protein
MKATLVVLNEPDFLQNRIFSDLPINGVKNYGYMFAELRRQLATQGVDLATQDVNPPEDSTLVIGLDEVAFFRNYQRQPGQHLYLLLNEPATYYPEVWEKENHAVFDRVFTYDYTLADGVKYIHHYFAIDLDGYPPFKEVTEAEFNKRKLLVLMAGMFQFTKPVPGSNSLLYTRYRSLLWFGKHWPQDFDFFSRGIAPSLYRSFRGLGALQRVLPKTITTAIVDLVAARRRRPIEAISRGPVPPNDKLNVIRNYRYVLCYENTRLPGYISEKLFDCLFAGCVPVYLGEPNIGKFVPAECFIDRAAFTTDAELANFLQRMPYGDYARYVAAMHRFVAGVERKKFGSEANAYRIAEVLLADLHGKPVQPGSPIDFV